MSLKLRKTFSKFYRRHYEYVSKFNVELKTLLHQGLLEPEFYGDLVYKFKQIVARADFSDQFRKIIVRYKQLITLLPSLIACRWVGRQTQYPDIKLFILVGWGRSFFVCCLAHRGSTVGFLSLQCSSGVVRYPRDLQVSVATHCFCRVPIIISS